MLGVSWIPLRIAIQVSAPASTQLPDWQIVEAVYRWDGSNQPQRLVYLNHPGFVKSRLVTAAKACHCRINSIDPVWVHLTKGIRANWIFKISWRLSF